jgi:hypothetical protein
MSKQTAVEWFQEQIIKIVNGTCELSEIQIFEQAKAMEKEQIVDAHIEGQRVFDNYQHTQWTTDQAEQYYNDTYGGDK